MAYGLTNPRDQIAQTMMNIGNPPPQVQGGMPPGTMMAPSPLKTLMGMDEQGPSSFMGGRAPPVTPQAQAPVPLPMQAPQPVSPPVQNAGPTPPPPPLFAPPPAVPGQTPPGFAPPPTY